MPFWMGGLGCSVYAVGLSDTLYTSANGWGSAG